LNRYPEAIVADTVDRLAFEAANAPIEFVAVYPFALRTLTVAAKLFALAKKTDARG
jgi:hypothetical protein